MQGRISRVFWLIAALAVMTGLGILAWRWWLNRSTMPVSEPELIALVGSHRIRAADFAHEMVRRGGRSPSQLDPSALLGEMIERGALLEKARELGLDRSAEVIRGHENLLIGTLRKRLLEPRLAAVEVSDEEARDYYRQHLGQFTVEAMRRLAILFVEIPAKADEEKRTACEQRIRQAHARALTAAADETAAGFGPLAVEFSEDQTTRYRGGDIGWVKRDEVRHNCPEKVVEAGFALAAVGDVSDVIETDAGLFLVRLMAERAQITLPYEAVAERVRHRLLLRQKEATETAFVEECKAAVAIRVFDDVLLRAVGPPPAADGVHSTAPAPPALP